MADKRMDDNPEAGFLSRWSRRKVLVREGVVVVPEAVPVAPQMPPVAPSTADASPAPVGAAPTQAPQKTTKPNLPPKVTLDDVEQLKPESDYSAFVSRSVDPTVRNAALKKLFTDPHYNVMDGLDIYIGDYNTFEPIPKSMLRQMVQARALGLLDDDLEAQPLPPGASTLDAVPETSSDDTSSNATPTTAPHEDIDLQLQPDDGARRAELGQSAGAEVPDGPPDGSDQPDARQRGIAAPDA